MKKMLAFLFLFFLAVATNEEYTVSIITNPTQGPFRIYQPVNFSCVVEPGPPDAITYQWKTVDRLDGQSTYTTQNFSLSYNYNNLRFCWYFCEASANLTKLGYANRVIEIQGFIYSTGPVLKSFNRGDNYQQLNINISTYYPASSITSLDWFHNGTRITSGTKYIISNSDTNLIINNLVDSDAGLYEVKISRVRFRRYSYIYPACEQIVLPLLEVIAAHAPVRFTLQQNCLPKYDPLLAAVTMFNFSKNNGTLELHSTALSNLASILSLSSYDSYWFRNGDRISDEGMYNLTVFDSEGVHSLVLTESTTEDVSGIYTEILSFDCRFFYFGLCEGYYYYFADDLRFCSVPLSASSWKTYHYPPALSTASVNLHIQQPILTRTESTLIWCTCYEKSEDSSLTLWWNNKQLAQVNGEQLNYSTTSYPFGGYQCASGNIRSNISILQEKATFQLLLNNIVQEQCEELMNYQNSILIAISDVLDSLYPFYADVTSSNIENLNLNCTETGYLTGDLVYSDFTGRITASTLLAMFSTWMLSQKMPSLLLNGHNVFLNKKCPVEMNAISRDVCFTMSADKTLCFEDSTSQITGGFFGGLIAGVSIMLVMCGTYYSIRRLKNVDPPVVATEKTADIPMGTNQAYETVDAHYAAAGRGREQDEVIYETPGL